MTPLRRIPWFSGAVFALCTVAMLLASSGAVSARSSEAPVWESGSEVRESLFDARSDLAFGNRADAVASAARAKRVYRKSLSRSIRAVNRGADRAARKAIAVSGAAVASGDVNAAAAAQGAAWAAILRGAASAAAEAAAAGDATVAGQWLLLRDFRTATRFTRPGTDATDAINLLKSKKISTEGARLAVEKDLLDTYQARQRELFGDVSAAREKDFDAKAVEAAAQAVGYWQILRQRYEQDFGAERLKAADAAFAAYLGAVERGEAGATDRAKARIDASLDGFVAAPFTAKEAARRAQQLFRFIELVPFEYNQAIDDGRVTAAFEIQEGIGFRDGAEQAFGDLKSKLERRDPARTAKVAAALEKLRVILKQVQEGGRVVPESELERITNNALAELKAQSPPAWTAKTDESDFDLINLTLDRMDAAINQGQWKSAEQARLESYAFLEFGPELKLRAFDPRLSLQLEGLVWYGAQGQKGLAALIANRADRQAIRPTRLALDRSLEQAQATLGEDQSAVTAVVNGAILVFREGLEAVLILAAITASMLGALARRKRAVLWGAALGLVLSIITWGVAQLVLGQLGQYGEKLEAVIGVIAIFVLLYVMNWFFHKVYWTEHIRKFHDRRRKLVGEAGEGEDEEEGEARVGFWSGQAIGFALLGVSSVYREGFETVLFLQSLQLATDTRTVVMGALLGLAITLAVALTAFKLQRKLPYKRMLIATGVMLAVVLFVMVGNTVRSLQGIGWMPVTPLDWEPPMWVGTWLGIFPSWQSLGLQVFSVTLVVGSYFLAEELRVKGPERRAARADAARAAAAEIAGESEVAAAPAEPAAQSEPREREPVA